MLQQNTGSAARIERIHELAGVLIAIGALRIKEQAMRVQKLQDGFASIAERKWEVIHNLLVALDESVTRFNQGTISQGLDQDAEIRAFANSLKDRVEACIRINKDILNEARIPVEMALRQNAPAAAAVGAAWATATVFSAGFFGMVGILAATAKPVYHKMAELMGTKTLSDSMQKLCDIIQAADEVLMSLDARRANVVAL